MASYNPPTEDLPIFDNEVFSASSATSTTILTVGLANLLYLRKTFPDTATALETFQAGIKTPSINPLTVGGTLSIVGGTLGINPDSGGATTNIHTNASGSSGTVNIMGGGAGGSSGTVNICNGTGGVQASVCNISTQGTIGDVGIGNSTCAVNINSSALSLGTSTKTLTVQTPVTINYTPTVLTATNMIGYTTRDDYTFTGTIPNSANQVLFTTDVALPTGVWLINYYIRIISASSTVISSYNSFGNTNRLGVTGQYYGGCGVAGNQTVTTALPCASSGSFVIQSGVSSITQYNIQVYIVGVSGGALSLDTGTAKGYCIRTRIA